MKQFLLFSLLVSFNLDAQNLNSILESLHESHIVKTLEYQRDSEIAKNSLVSDYEAPQLGLSVAHAKDSVEDGVEYSLGISQEIINPFSTSEKNKAQNNLDLAIKQETRHEIHLLELEIASKYYAACISQEMSEQTQTLFQEQSSRYLQLENAYNLGEISKKDLLFNKLDLAKLKQKATLYTRVKNENFFTLQSALDNVNLESIACDDLIAPQKEIHLKNLNRHNELKTIAYKQNASRALYQLNDSYLPSITYGLMYEQELDTKRYTASINIPLSGMSTKQQSLKTQQLMLNSSYVEQEQMLRSEIKNNSKKLLTEVESMYTELDLLTREVLPLSKELLTLSKSAFREGEGTIMEYIDSSRSYSENLLEMLEVKKSYYEKLFELYKTADKEYGEIK